VTTLDPRLRGYVHPSIRPMVAAEPARKGRQGKRRPGGRCRCPGEPEAI
jgi:hypothetical protein